jgi:hypothetical protein
VGWAGESQNDVSDGQSDGQSSGMGRQEATSGGTLERPVEYEMAVGGRPGTRSQPLKGRCSARLSYTGWVPF